MNTASTNVRTHLSLNKDAPDFFAVCMETPASNRALDLFNRKMVLYNRCNGYWIDIVQVVME